MEYFMPPSDIEAHEERMRNLEEREKQYKDEIQKIELYKKEHPVETFINTILDAIGRFFEGLFAWIFLLSFSAFFLYVCWKVLLLLIRV